MNDFNKVTLAELQLLHSSIGLAVEVNDGEVTGVIYEEVATNE